MHLYVHEFNDPKDVRLEEVKDLLFANSLKDYQSRIGKRQRNLKVAKTKHGKPYFQKISNMHFSISHSGKYWVCMFDSENVGVDVEDYTTRNMEESRLLEISKRFFLNDETDYVIGNSQIGDSDEDIDEDLKNRFFRIWTAKEAYMKYTGNGFTEGFKNFSALDGSLELCFKTVPVDPYAVLTFCTKRDTNLDELINI